MAVFDCYSHSFLCVQAGAEPVRGAQEKKPPGTETHPIRSSPQGFHNEQWGQGWNCDGDAGQSCGMGLFGKAAVRGVVPICDAFPTRKISSIANFEVYLTLKMDLWY